LLDCRPENRGMSMHPQPISPILEDTARVARAAFPKGKVYIEMRDVLGSVYGDEDFEELFKARGRPAIAPWGLGVGHGDAVLGRSFSDRQAAEAVRFRIDWKYALGLQLSDPGFDFSVLSEFRSRLLEGGIRRGCSWRSCLRGARSANTSRLGGAGSAPTPPVCWALCAFLSKWERTTETMRAALNVLATTNPDWLREHADPEWFLESVTAVLSKTNGCPRARRRG